MDFKTQAQKECYEKIAKWMTEIYGEERVMTLEQSPEFGLLEGSALIRVIVNPRGDDKSYVCTRSYMISGAKIDSELMRFLLKENTTFIFGAFGIDDDGDILFDHTIPGETIDKGELRASVSAVAGTADKYDDKIRSQWGGLRFEDQMLASKNE